MGEFMFVHCASVHPSPCNVQTWPALPLPLAKNAMHSLTSILHVYMCNAILLSFYTHMYHLPYSLLPPLISSQLDVFLCSCNLSYLASWSKRHGVRGLYCTSPLTGKTVSLTHALEECHVDSNSEGEQSMYVHNICELY